MKVLSGGGACNFRFAMGSVRGSWSTRSHRCAAVSYRSPPDRREGTQRPHRVPQPLRSLCSLAANPTALGRLLEVTDPRTPGCAGDQMNSGQADLDQTQCRPTPFPSQMCLQICACPLGQSEDLSRDQDLRIIATAVAINSAQASIPKPFNATGAWTKASEKTRHTACTESTLPSVMGPIATNRQQAARPGNCRRPGAFTNKVANAKQTAGVSTCTRSHGVGTANQSTAREWNPSEFQTAMYHAVEQTSSSDSTNRECRRLDS